MSIRVHILTQQGNFFCPKLYHFSHFMDNIFHWTTFFSSASVGNYTIRAEVVASLNNRNKSTRHHIFRKRQIFIRFRYSHALFFNPAKQLIIIPWFKEKINLGELSVKFICIGIGKTASYQYG